MAALIDNPFAPTLLVCLAAGLALSLLARLGTSPLPASLVAPVVFLVAYVASYQDVPDFPPVGSTNKIFFIALAGTVAGIVVDLVTLSSRLAGRSVLFFRRFCETAAPPAVAIWIGLPRFAELNTDFLLALAGLAIGGIAVLWRLDAVAATDRPDGGEMVATAMLAALSLGFAPIALFGASSTSFGLCLGLAAGLAASALVALAWPRRFGSSAILGAGSGLLAVVDTVTLITQKVDWLALLVSLSVLFAGQVGARVLLPSGRPGVRMRRLTVALLGAAPVPVIVAILFLRHPNPIG
jgi:hypothetical protein